MSNVDQSFDLSKVLEQLSQIVPFLLIFSAVGSFVFVGFFSVHYYEKLFSPVGSYARTMAVVIAVITELVRFSLLLASVRDFSDKKPFNGWLGLVGSVALVFHEISVARSIAAMLTPENEVGLISALVFMILAGFGLEIRLVMTMRQNQNISTNQKSSTKNGKEFFTNENIFTNQKSSTEKKSSNGVYNATET